MADTGKIIAIAGALDKGKLSVPATPGTSGQVLVSNGNGGQVWANIEAGEVVVDPTLSVSGAAADAAVTGELKSAFDATFVSSDFSDSLSKGKYFKQSTGANGSSTKYMRTTNLLEANGKISAISISDSSTYKFYLTFYDATGAVDGTGYTGHTELGNILTYIPKAAAKYGISIKREDEADMTDNDTAPIKAALKKIYATDSTLTQWDKAADAKATGDKIAAILPVINSVYTPCGMREIAHQGYNNNAPSNSIGAYRDACMMGAWGVNTAQVRHSADGTLWIMHDATVDGTTDGTGSIGTLTDAYLSGLKVNGTGTDADRKIPKLEDVFKLCNKYGTIPMIRFATAGSGKFTYNAYDSSYAELFRLIKKYNLEDRVMFSGEVTALSAVIDKYFPKALKVPYQTGTTTVQDMVTLINANEWFDKRTVVGMVSATYITESTASTAYNDGIGLYASSVGENSLETLAELGVQFFNSGEYVTGFIPGVNPTMRKIIMEMT